jgi:(p)ppGpp synthase/HD superfamily hydrolase
VRVAQTNVQLYNELRVRGVARNELVLVHRAYELLTTLYPGYYQADGKPFVAHTVGVASILGQLGQPSEIVAVGLLHNVYGNADFGDGRGPGATPARRRLVRDELGARIEELLVRFAQLRTQGGAAGTSPSRVGALDDTERRLLIVDLADHLEKYVDLGVLYYGENDWIIDTERRIGSQLMQLAEELGEPRLVEALRSGFADAAAHAEVVPFELRPSDGRRYLTLVVPRSCRRRLLPAVRDWIRQVRGRLRPRTRLRHWRDGWRVRTGL